MKKIVFLVILCGTTLFAFFVFSCKQSCDIEIEKPNDVKPIDWNNYNDVYTVFWNIFKNDCIGSGYLTSDTIKVYGIIDELEYDYYGGFHSFLLISESKYEDNFIYDHLYNKYKYKVPSVNVYCYHITEELQSIIDSCDITKKKCYIKGELGTRIITHDAPLARCCFTVPCVTLYSIYDIYFEEEEE